MHGIPDGLVAAGVAAQDAGARWGPDAVAAARELALAAYGSPEARVFRGPAGAEAARVLLAVEGWATPGELATLPLEAVLARIRLVGADPGES